MAYFNTCPMCGSNLDPGERCDCERIRQEQRQESQEFYGRFLTVERNRGQLRFVFDGKGGKVKA